MLFSGDSYLLVETISGDYKYLVDYISGDYKYQWIIITRDIFILSKYFV